MKLSTLLAIDALERLQVSNQVDKLPNIDPIKMMFTQEKLYGEHIREYTNIDFEQFRLLRK